MEWPGYVEVRRDCCCGVCIEWVVCCLSMFLKTFTECALIATSILEIRISQTLA